MLISCLREPIHVSHIKNLGGIREEDQNLACNNGNSGVLLLFSVLVDNVRHTTTALCLRHPPATHWNVLISDDTTLARTK